MPLVLQVSSSELDVNWRCSFVQTVQTLVSVGEMEGVQVVIYSGVDTRQTGALSESRLKLLDLRWKTHNALVWIGALAWRANGVEKSARVAHAFTSESVHWGVHIGMKGPQYISAQAAHWSILLAFYVAYKTRPIKDFWLLKRQAVGYWKELLSQKANSRENKRRGN